METKSIENQIKTLKERAEERWQWLIENTEKPNWMEVKRDYNAITVKIEALKQRLNPPVFHGHAVEEISVIQYTRIARNH